MIKGIWQSIVGGKADLQTKVFETYSETDIPGKPTVFASKSQVRLEAYKKQKGLIALLKGDKSADEYEIKVCRQVSYSLSNIFEDNVEAQIPQTASHSSMPYGFEEGRTYTKAEMQNIFNQWEIVVHDKALDMKMPKALQAHFNLGDPDRNKPKSEDSPFRNRGIKPRVSKHQFV
jgi:hypothetical protein